MRCEQIQPILLEYSLQPSSCPDHQAIEAHLDGCESCRTTLEQERKLASDLSVLTSLGPSPDVWPVIRDRIRVKTPVWQRLRIPVFQPARGLAAAGLAVLLIAGATFFGINEHGAQHRQNEALVHLVQMQQGQPPAWTDDPLKDRSDRAQSLIEEGS